VDPRFLFAWIRGPVVQGKIEDLSSGSTNQIELSRSAIRDMEIPVAPLNEQKRIADKLDLLLANLDACRQRLDRVPQILKKFREAVLEAAVSGRLTEEWREIHGIRESWHDAPLSALCSRVSVGHVGVTSKHYTNAESGVPFLRSQNVRPGKVSLEGLTFITRDFHQSLRKSQLQPGDLLVVRVGANRGDACVLTDTFVEVNCANIVFARPTKVLPAYLNVFFQSPRCRTDLLGRSVGGAQGVINTRSVEKISVALPPESEQLEIARTVHDLLAIAARLELQLDGERRRIGRILPAILAKAFRGELVPQNPRAERVVETRERIESRHGTNESGSREVAVAVRYRGRKMKSFRAVMDKKLRKGQRL
jgi:type I restriction enzyme S subunit